MKRLFLALLFALTFAATAQGSLVFNENKEGYLIQTGASAAFAPMPSTGSLSFWVYPTWAQADGVTHVFWNVVIDGVTGGTSQMQGIKFSDNSLYFGWLTGGVSHRVVVLTANYTLNQNAWNHFLFTWNDTSNNSVLYLNGTSIGTAATLVTWTTVIAPMVGAQFYSTAPNNQCDCRMAEFAIWSTDLPSSAAMIMNGNGAGHGYSPAFFSQNLQVYVPGITLDGSGVGQSMPRWGVYRFDQNISGTKTFTDHPPIRYPFKSMRMN